MRTGAGCGTFYVCQYEGGALPELPWGSADFDRVLVATDDAKSRFLGGEFSDEIVKHAVDYMQTTGVHAEWLHDLVDEAHGAAQIAGAARVGAPMTTWHEDARSLDEIVEVAEHCLGGADQVLCVIVGSPDDQKHFSRLLQGRLSATD